MRKLNIKHIALSIVAFVLILILAVGVTFSWIDDVKLVEFENDDLVADGAPLKTGVDINSDIEITSESNSIDFGNMLDKDDLTYTYTDNGTTKRHTKYDGGSNEPDWDYINENKGYFYESGDMHLSGCYSDGETFYFPRQGTSGYREGNKDDENVNYISFTTRVSSPNANIDFWFRKIPTICKKNSDNAIAKARYAIIVDGECHVYSSDGSYKTLSSSTATSTTTKTDGRKTANYTYNDSSNTTTERGKNSNTLFSIAKGDTVNLTVKIWLENGFDTDITASDIDFQLVSSWAYTRTIKIVDKTTNGSGASWINNDSAKLYVTCPEILKDYADDLNKNVAQWNTIKSSSGYEKAPFYQITLDSGSTTTYSVEVPLCFNNEKMILYRCSASGWNTGTHNGKTGDYGVTYWNWWSTYMPNTYKTETYTLYGSSYDDVAVQGFGGTETDKGYGTWGSVEQIEVYSHYNNVEYADYQNGNARLYLRDYSDYDTSGEIYTFVMYRGNNNASTSWKCYVPASSAKLQFDYYSGGNITAVWGYNSWNNTNPQRRPLKSTGLYSSNSTVYHFAQHYGTDDYRNGWGYWEGADTVYLIKSGFLSSTSTTAHAYMFNSASSEKQAYPGETLSRLKYTDNTNVSYTWDGGTKTAEVWKTGSPRVYKYIVFNNGYGGAVNTDKTNDLALFPGCFYQVDGSKWYGSLDDKGRTATEQESGGSGGGDSSGTDTGGGSMSGYTSDSKFVFKVDGNNYYAKTNGTKFKVRVNLASGDNWTTVQYQEGNYPNYGNGQAGQYYEPKDGVDLYLYAYNSNNFSIRTNSSGNYIVSFEYDNGNTNTIKITSILKED